MTDQYGLSSFKRVTFDFLYARAAFRISKVSVAD